MANLFVLMAVQNSSYPIVPELLVSTWAKASWISFSVPGNPNEHHACRNCHSPNPPQSSSANLRKAVIWFKKTKRTKILFKVDKTLMFFFYIVQLAQKIQRENLKTFGGKKTVTKKINGFWKEKQPLHHSRFNLLKVNYSKAPLCVHDACGSHSSVSVRASVLSSSSTKFE